MISSYRSTFAIALALIPALALAAPRSKAKKKKRAKTTVTQPAEPSSEPADTPDESETTPGSSAAPSAVPAPGAGSGSAPVPSPTAPATPATPSAPQPGEPAEPSPAPAVGAREVDALRQEYLSLRDELFTSRARATAVAGQLYTSRVQIKLTYTSARFYNPAKAVIRLDGATVWEDASGKIGGDDAIRFDGFVAPGRHLVTFRVEATGKDDEAFSSVTESQIVVQAVAGKDLVVAAKARDSGDIAYAWKRGERGTYGLGLEAVVKTVPRAGGAAR